MAVTEPELHLFLIWLNARSRQEDIIKDIAASFEIVRIMEVTWSDTYYSSNLTRFYGQRLPDRSFKELHCGKGTFVVIVVRDLNPRYEMRNTSHGPSKVNVTMFDKKQTYRNWTGGGHRIHATDTVEETDHNLVLLTGLSADDFLKKHSSPFCGEVETVKQDLPGANGWETIEQLFYVLNHTVSYIVMRNFEGLPHQYTLKTHGDIDLLADSPLSLRYILNARPVFPNTARILHYAVVDGEKVLFDFRSVGDGYYATDWETAMIDNRIYDENGFYRPPEKDYFYSLLYHALIHKPAVAEDYKQRLSTMAESQNITLTPADFDNREHCIALLRQFLTEKEYHITEPADTSVYFNRKGTSIKAVSVTRVITSSKTLGEAIGGIVGQSADCSSDSPELQSPEIIGQPTLRYHFSRERNFPLSTILLNATMRVVEFGAQTGVTTRFLAERCEQVCAIEPNPDLAAAARIRCEKLNNVEIVSDIPGNEKDTADFDCAVMLFPTPQPGAGHLTHIALRKWLQAASTLLKKNGVVLLAIDNAESVMDPLLEKQNKGLSGKEINELLTQAGFTDLKFNYAFPDHLFPQTIFTEESLKLDSTTIAGWAASTVFTHAKGGSVRMPLFARLFNKLLTDGAFGEKAPAFIAVAGKQPFTSPTWLVKKFTGFPRRIEAHTETDLVREGQELRVVKSGKPMENGVFRFQPCSNEPLYNGETVETKLVSVVSAGDKSGFLSLLAEFAEYLKNTFPVATDMSPLGDPSDSYISGNALDCTFGNVMVNGSAWRSFDLEWKCSLPLPVSLVLFRALSLYLQSVDTSKVTALFSLPDSGSVGDSLFKVFQQLPPHFRISGLLFNYYVDFEDRFYSFALDRKREKPSFLELYLSLYHLRETMDAREQERLIASIHKAFPGVPELERIRTDFPHPD